MKDSERADGLAARVQRLEDRVAIGDLVAAYCRAIDERDLDLFVALFTEDAVQCHADGVLELAGRAAIREYYQQRFANYGVTVHSPHSHTVVFNGPAHATGTVTGHAEMSVDGELVVAAIRY